MPRKSSPEEIATPLDPSAYDSLDLNRLVVFTLGWLRDHELPPTFENVVVTAFRLFPAKFSLRGFEYPDANRTNRALLQLGPNGRNWALGSPKTGFVLTHNGEDRLAETRDLLATSEPTARRPRPSRNGYTWDVARDLEELRSSAAYTQYQIDGGQSMTIDEVWQALGAYPYTPRTAVKQRLTTLGQIAKAAGDQEMERFIDRLRVVLTHHEASHRGRP